MSLPTLKALLDQADADCKVDASASDLGRRARQEIVDIVSAISAFEGGGPSDFYRTEREKFVSGEIGADELHARVVEHWNRRGP